MKKELEEIYQIQKEIMLLNRTINLLGWDQAVFMPLNAEEYRAEQIGVLSRMSHERLTSKKLEKLVKTALKTKLNKKDKIIITRLAKDIKKEKKLPPEFVEELSKVTSKSYIAWRTAKQTDNFKLFEPHLKKIIELKRKEARFKRKNGHIYDALLDDYEEGMTVKKLKKTFDYLKKELIILLKCIQATEKYKKQERLIPPTVPKEIQQELVCFAAKKIGLKLGEESRLDETEHPFTSTVGMHDTRITTNYTYPFPTSFFCTIHEAGHALYSLGIPDEYVYTVVGTGTSLGMHESQSRFYENTLARSGSFWKFMFPRLKKYKEFKKYSFDDWFLLLNKVQPSLIRVTADEITYNLHVILRFELELALLEGKIKVKDLPKVWNKKIKEYFGITPPNDTKGVLQDVHWSHGLFGYFPTYTIGNTYASQLYKEMLKQYPKSRDDIIKGKFDLILKWLRNNVHKHARTMTSEEIVKKACGKGLDPKALITYLREKYSEIYKF